MAVRTTRKTKVADQAGREVELDAGTELDVVVRPGTDPVVLLVETKVKDPETGDQVVLAAGTQLSPATAAKLGLAPKR